MKDKMQIGSQSVLHLENSSTSRLLLSMVLLVVPFVASCGGSAAVNTPPLTVAIAISPSAVSLPAGGSQSFTASVQGTTNTAVIWAVQEGTAGGSISSAGVYIAPQIPGTYHALVTSQADSTKSATATVTVHPVSVAISPVTVSLGTGQTQTFTASVQGTTNTAVTWAVQEGAAGGAITNLGVYTAPTTLGTYHVIATSQADSTKSAVGIVTVITVVQSGFRPTGTMNGGHVAHTATLLPNGTVMIVGCADDPDGLCHFRGDLAELYDPAPGTFSISGRMGSERAFHTATLLLNGTVLVAGGFSATAELYDPATRLFMPTGSMGSARGQHTATLLLNGRVLITGGWDLGFPNLSSAELYE